MENEVNRDWNKKILQNGLRQHLEDERGNVGHGEQQERVVDSEVIAVIGERDWMRRRCQGTDATMNPPKGERHCVTRHPLRKDRPLVELLRTTVRIGPEYRKTNRRPKCWPWNATRETAPVIRTLKMSAPTFISPSAIARRSPAFARIKSQIRRSGVRHINFFIPHYLRILSFKPSAN